MKVMGFFFSKVADYNLRKDRMKASFMGSLWNLSKRLFTRETFGE